MIPCDADCAQFLWHSLGFGCESVEWRAVSAPAGCLSVSLSVSFGFLAQANMALKLPSICFFEATKMTEDRILKRYLAQTGGFWGILDPQGQDVAFAQLSSKLFTQSQYVASKGTFKSFFKARNLPSLILSCHIGF